MRPTEVSKLEAQRIPRPVYASYRKVGATCVDCSLEGEGCYAEYWRVLALSNRAEFETFDPVAWVGKMWHQSLVRWNVSGDIWGSDGAEYREAIKQAHLARPDVEGWLYTHAWRRAKVLAWIPTLPANLSVLASCDTIHDAIQAYWLGFTSVAIVDDTARKEWADRSEMSAARDRYKYIADSFGVPVIPCPAQLAGNGVGCADCQACLKPGLIVFAPHGPGGQIASSALKGKRSLPVVR